MKVQVLVIDVGKDIKSLKSSDKVMLNWAIPCYLCFQCQEGNQHVCETNSAVAAGNKLSQGHATFASTQYKNAPIERAFSLGTKSEYTHV
jgi:Zn-dependent alcohol dehydrogenase